MIDWSEILAKVIEGSPAKPSATFVAYCSTTR
jgi:hypothetical protein